MFGFQLDQQVGVLRAGAVGLVKGEIVGNRQADIVADARELSGRDDAANLLFEAIDDVLGVLDPGAAGHPDVEAHHARVDRWEKILAGGDRQEHRSAQCDRDTGQAEPAARDEDRERGAIALAHPLEARVEASHEAIPAAGSVVLLVLVGQQVMRHRGDQRAREEVRGEHRVDHGQRQRREQEPGDPAEQRDREKHDADRERADQRGRCDLACAVENRDQQRLFHRVVAMDVLDLDRSVVDQHPDRQSQAAQRHDVEGLAGNFEQDDRGQDRKRDRGDDDQRAARRAQEHQHHQCDQEGRDRRLAYHLPQRSAHKGRLVEGQRQVNPLDRRGHDLRDLPA